MKLTTQKRIAAELLKVGKSRVKLDITKLQEIKESITKSDIRSLIKKGIITAKTTSYQSKYRSRKLKIQKRKGRRKGPGSKKGKQTARLSRKKAWMIKVRSQRKYIRNLKTKNVIAPRTFRRLYTQIKGNQFRSKRHIKIFLEENKLFTKR